MEDFEIYMFQHGKGWNLVNETGSMLVYEKIQQAQKGSCLIALILLILFIIPGVLYLYFTSKPAKTFRLTVKVDSKERLIASGDPEGLSLYESFTKKDLQVSRIERAIGWAKKHWLVLFLIASTLLLFISIAPIPPPV